MKKTFLSIALTLMVTLSISAQRIKLIEGDLASLKGVTSLQSKYDYSNMAVGKFDKEADYVAKKRTEYNDKEAGKGDKWAESWIADRESRFEPQFEELFNKNSDIELSPKASKYTLILKTTFTEPGFNVYITRKNAIIDAEVWIVDSGNPSHVLAKMKIEKSPGRTFGGYDFDTGGRIQEAYAAAGKALGRFLSK